MEGVETVSSKEKEKDPSVNTQTRRCPGGSRRNTTLYSKKII